MRSNTVPYVSKYIMTVLKINHPRLCAIKFIIIEHLNNRDISNQTMMRKIETQKEKRKSQGVV